MIIDLSQRIEAHWAWDTFPLVSQSYEDGDEFQEFGLRWSGQGFTYASSPGWKIKGEPSLDDLPISNFVGMASVINLSNSNQGHQITPGQLIESFSGELRPIVLLRTGHALMTPIRRREYWSESVKLSPAIADFLAERGVVNVCVDFSCDCIPSRRSDTTGGIYNFNEDFRSRAHSHGMVVTENLIIPSDLPKEAFVFALPLRGQGFTTSLTRPVALSKWPSENPTIYDVSTPYMNHWRWRLELWQTITQTPFEDRTEFIQMGHAYTHCDAPRHMNKNGCTIQELSGGGLDLFIGPTWIVDLSDLVLPTQITRDLLISRAGNPPIGSSIILRTDLTNKLGYSSTRWHLDAPNLQIDAAKWLISKKPSAICLDFPQDFIAREMPGRHVFNKEFTTHHTVFDAGIPFVEDLRDLGEVKCKDPYLAAIPLKMTCVDGAPMRAIILDWG